MLRLELGDAAALERAKYGRRQCLGFRHICSCRPTSDELFAKNSTRTAMISSPKLS